MEDSLMKKIYKHRSLISQIVFIGLILSAQKRLMHGTINIIYNKQINYRIAGLIALAFILETIGALWKIPLMHKRNPINKSDGLIFFGLLMHCVVAMMLVMTFIAAISGTGISEVDKTPYKWLMWLIVLEVIRHIVVPVIIGLKTDTTETKESPIKEILGEIFILFWAFIAYTTTRSTMVTQWSFGLGWWNIALTVIYTICATIIFRVFYLGANLVWIIHQYEQAETRVQQNRFWIYIIIITIIALTPLFTKPAVN